MNQKKMPRWNQQTPSRLDQLLTKVRLSLELASPNFNRAHSAIDDYQRQLESDETEGVPLDETGLPSAICSWLADFDIFTARQIQDMTDAQLAEIPKIGPEKIRLIRKFCKNRFDE